MVLRYSGLPPWWLIVPLVAVGGTFLGLAASSGSNPNLSGYEPARTATVEYVFKQRGEYTIALDDGTRLEFPTDEVPSELQAFFGGLNGNLSTGDTITYREKSGASEPLHAAAPPNGTAVVLAYTDAN